MHRLPAIMCGYAGRANVPMSSQSSSGKARQGGAFKFEQCIRLYPLFCPLSALTLRLVSRPTVLCSTVIRRPRICPGALRGRLPRLSQGLHLCPPLPARSDDRSADFSQGCRNYVHNVHVRGYITRNLSLPVFKACAKQTLFNICPPLPCEGANHTVRKSIRSANNGRHLQAQRFAATPLDWRQKRAPSLRRRAGSRGCHRRPSASSSHL